MTTFQRTDSDNVAFQTLVALLDEDLQKRDGDEHSFYAQFNKIVNIRNVVVCYINDKPIGCGAFKAYLHKKVEIKRMFVTPEYRGQGIGLGILNELELWALELKYAACILETGKKQPEAIKLYQKAGYKIIKNFGQYENIENSVCMEKNRVQFKLSLLKNLTKKGKIHVVKNSKALSFGEGLGEVIRNATI